VSPNKTLYIRDEDMPIWEGAESAARLRGISLSQLVTQALARTAPPPPGPDLFGEIRVETGIHYQRIEAFHGYWLVEPDRDRTRTAEDGYDAGAYWGVALTRRGQIAVYTAHCNQGFPGTLAVFPNLAEAGLPDDIRADAAAALGEEYVMRLDI
jgi:hypothetical protein